MTAGGPVMAVLAALSVLALMVVLAKLWQLFAWGLWRRQPAESALELAAGGHWGAAAKEAASLPPHPAAALAAWICAMRAETARGGPAMTAAELHVAAERQAQAGLDRVRGGLRLLAFVTATAPLLGLFGTVLGMIAAFQQLELAGRQVDPGRLSGGIWEALLTTAAGLAVAIPASAFLAFFQSVGERTAIALEDVAAALLPAGRDGSGGIPS
ncbi:MAG: MotA/TolQ/ExbB proton channel family protein [Sneathiellaceae bacterium]